MGSVHSAGTLVLIGPMGAGKSEVGRRLGRLLGRQFHDTDRMVENKAGKTVEEIFRDDGEAAFRSLESAAVKEAVRAPGSIIACGGGVVLDPSNIEVLRSSGVVVYLRPSLQAAAARIGPSDGRPLLDTDDPLSTLAKLQESREPLYSQAADHVVDADPDVQEVARAVLAVWAADPPPQSAQGTAVSR